jgi:hypothetical protein
VRNGLAFDYVLTLISTQSLLEGMIQAISRVCGAGLTRLREIHFVLASPKTDDPRSFKRLIVSAMGDLHIPHPLKLRAYELHLPNLAFTWPQAGVVLEFGNLTLDYHLMVTHNLSFWAHNIENVTAVTLSDVIIDMPAHWRGVYGKPSDARRLVFRRIHIVLDVPSTPGQSWAAYWDSVRTQNTNLEELIVEECGYVHQGADGKSFVPADDVSPLVSERDAEALRDLRAVIAARALT